jgi:MFS family permease
VRASEGRARRLCCHALSRWNFVPQNLFSDFRALDRRIFVLAFARLVVTLGFASVLPYLGVTLHQERGVPATVVGIIWTAAGLSGALMQWVAGEIADRVGRRPVLLGAMVLRTINLAALGYEILHGGPILAIAALCVLNGILRAFFDPVASAMVADLATGERRIAAFSLQRIGVNIGWAFGTMTLVFTRTFHIAYGQMFYASAVVTLLAALAASAIKETAKATTSARPPWRLTDLGAYRHDRRFMRFLLATFFFFLLQAQLYAPLSLYAADHLKLGLIQVSHVYSLNGWMVVLLQVPAFYYIRRTGTHRVLPIGALAYAASYALCGLATRELHLLLCVASITIAEIISAPAQQTAATGMAPANRIGAYAGLFGLSQAFGQSLGPLLGTSLLDILPDRLTWPLLALCGIAAALLYRDKASPTYQASPTYRASPTRTTSPT